VDGGDVFGYVGFIERGEFAHVAVGAFDDEGLHPVLGWLPDWRSDTHVDDVEWRADPRYGQTVIESPHEPVSR
jgi:hypothetical protein